MVVGGGDLKHEFETWHVLKEQVSGCGNLCWVALG
jgi:hypothetical protein